MRVCVHMSVCVLSVGAVTRPPDHLQQRAEKPREMDDTHTHTLSYFLSVSLSLCVIDTPAGAMYRMCRRVESK